MPFIARCIAIVSAAVLVGIVTPVTQAQTFPTRPIRWLVPVPAGSTTDIVTRIVAQKMSDAFGQQVVVDNRPGGVMTIATRRLHPRDAAHAHSG